MVTGSGRVVTLFMVWPCGGLLCWCTEKPLRLSFPRTMLLFKFQDWIHFIFRYCLQKRVKKRPNRSILGLHQHASLKPILCVQHTLTASSWVPVTVRFPIIPVRGRYSQAVPGLCGLGVKTDLDTVNLFIQIWDVCVGGGFFPAAEVWNVCRSF